MEGSQVTHSHSTRQESHLPGLTPPSPPGKLSRWHGPRLPPRSLPLQLRCGLHAVCFCGLMMHLRPLRHVFDLHTALLYKLHPSCSSHSVPPPTCRWRIAAAALTLSSTSRPERAAPTKLNRPPSPSFPLVLAADTLIMSRTCRSGRPAGRCEERVLFSIQHLEGRTQCLVGPHVMPCAQRITCTCESNKRRPQSNTLSDMSGGTTGTCLLLDHAHSSMQHLMSTLATKCRRCRAFKLSDWLPGTTSLHSWATK